MVMGCERADWRMQTHTKGEWSEGGVSKSVSRSVIKSVRQGRHLYQEQRPWGASSCFHHFPDVGLERGGGVKEGWRWRWGGEGQRGGCRAKGCDDDNKQQQQEPQAHVVNSLLHVVCNRLQQCGDLLYLTTCRPAVHHVHHATRSHRIRLHVWNVSSRTDSRDTPQLSVNMLYLKKYNILNLYACLVSKVSDKNMAFLEFKPTLFKKKFPYIGGVSTLTWNLSLWNEDIF